MLVIQYVIDIESLAKSHAVEDSKYKREASWSKKQSSCTLQMQRVLVILVGVDNDFPRAPHSNHTCRNWSPPARLSLSDWLHACIIWSEGSQCEYAVSQGQSASVSWLRLSFNASLSGGPSGARDTLVSLYQRDATLASWSRGCTPPGPNPRWALKLAI